MATRKSTKRPERPSPVAGRGRGTRAAPAHRTSTLQVKVSPAEKSWLDRCARELGLTTSAWLRTLAIRKGKTILPREDV